MRVFISVDMEGVAGVATIDQVVRGGTGYPRAQELITQEANAAIRGAFAGGATDVLVNDSHGTMDNFLHDRLDPGARVVFGAPRASCMMQGITRDDDLALFIGYHAAAGADGVLAHTFSSNFTELCINGQAMSEAEVNALYAAAYGVPVGVVTGDDQICAAATKAFFGVTTVEIKKTNGFAATNSLVPSAARAAIETSVAEAVVGADALQVQSLPDEFVLDVDFARALGADYAASVPRSLRLSPRTLRYAATHVDELFHAVTAWSHLAALASQQTSAIAVRR